MSCQGSADTRQTVVQAQLSVRGGRAAVEFYKAAFGAVERYRVGGTDRHEAVVCQLSIGDAYFWVAPWPPISPAAPITFPAGT